MGNLTLANQLTILRIMLIPAFVLLVVYGYLGWALLVFMVAGITDALDGLIARRAGQRTSLGAWLDPMADKLLLVTTFIVLTLPGIPLTNHLPLWLTVQRDQPRRRHRRRRRHRQPRGRTAHVQAVGLGKADDGRLHPDERRGDVLQLPARDVDGRRRLSIWLSLALTLSRRRTTSCGCGC